MAASWEMSSGSSGMLISPSKNRCLSPSNIWVLRFKHRSGLSAFLPPLTPIAEMSVISLFLLSSAMRSTTAAPNADFVDMDVLDVV